MPSINQLRQMDSLKSVSCFVRGDSYFKDDDFGINIHDAINNKVVLNIYYRGYRLVSLRYGISTFLSLTVV